jgi:hypothetical protein
MSRDTVRFTRVVDRRRGPRRVDAPANRARARQAGTTGADPATPEGLFRLLVRVSPVGVGVGFASALRSLGEAVGGG